MASFLALPRTTHDALMELLNVRTIGPLRAVAKNAAVAFEASFIPHIHIALTRPTRQYCIFPLSSTLQQEGGGSVRAKLFCMLNPIRLGGKLLAGPIGKTLDECAISAKALTVVVMEDSDGFHLMDWLLHLDFLLDFDILELDHVELVVSICWADEIFFHLVEEKYDALI